MKLLGRDPLDTNIFSEGTENPHLAGAAIAGNLESMKLATVDPQRILTRVMEDDLGKKDVIVPWSDMNFAGLKTVHVKDHGDYMFSERAFDQLCGRLGIPAQYLRKCPWSGHAGRQATLEYWREHTDEGQVLLRLKDFPAGTTEETKGELRAVLPKSYEPVDNARLTQWMMTAVEKSNHSLKVLYANVGKATTHFRMAWDEPIDLGTLEHPDIHYFGIHIADSEVGMRGLSMELLMFRLACMNGMIAEVENTKLLYQKHIHVDTVTLAREFQEAIDVALDHRATLTNMLTDSRRVEIRDPRAEIEKLARHYRGTKEFTNRVLAAWDLEAPPSGVAPTRFHVLQAFTRAARTMPIDRRMRVEALAGDILMNS